MPSQLHEALLALFRNQPALGPELLRDALRVELPTYTETRIESADLTDIQPAEYRADLVLVLRDDRPALGIVVEVQLGIDDRKRFAWPVYVAGLRARMQCPVCLLVVTPHRAVARWANKEIDLGGGSRLKPHVLGPACVPEIVDEVRAKSDPELAVLSAMAHGRDRDARKAARIADAAIAAISDLDEERKQLYVDWVLKALSKAAGRRVQTMSFKFEPQSDFARKYFAQGVIEGRAATLLKLLQLKFGPLPESVMDRVKSASTAELDAWTERVLSASSLDEVVG